MINCCTYICETKSLDGGKSFDFVLTNQDIMKVSKVVVVTNKISCLWNFGYLFNLKSNVPSLPDREN